MHQVDANIRVEWRVHDGDTVEGDSTLFTLHGAARSLLTAERTALNFLQLLPAPPPPAITTHNWLLEPLCACSTPAKPSPV